MRRRYSDFEWLRSELERDSKVLCVGFFVYFTLFECNITVLFLQIVVPPLPGKAIKRQLPFRNDDGIYDEDFIEDRRKALEAFVNKYKQLSFHDSSRNKQASSQ